MSTAKRTRKAPPPKPRGGKTKSKSPPTTKSAPKVSKADTKPIKAQLISAKEQTDAHQLQSPRPELMPNRVELGQPAIEDSTPSRRTARAGPNKTSLFVVGIGASAGGLDAFERFFRSMPPDSGAAFVLVPHLDPSKSTFLPELI